MTQPPSLYPVFLELNRKNVLVVGGGAVAERKVRALLPSGANVRVGAPALTPALQEWAGTGTIRWLAGHFEPAWLEGSWLVIAATDDRPVNARISELANAQHIWVNVVDDPELSAFQVPAVVDRAPITIAISSGGHAPVLARRLRERLETLVGHGTGKLAALLAQRRPEIRTAYPDLAQRRHFYDWTLDGPLLALIDQGNTQAAATLLDQTLAVPAQPAGRMLSILAAPTDDPGLLTLKGLRALHQADALLFDPNHHKEAVLGMARRDAERLPLQFASWLEETDASHSLLRTLEEHGRVVLLTRPQDSTDTPQFQKLLFKLKASNVMIERL